MPALRKIAFLLDEFAVASPAHQLLDRFLIGYPRDGTLHRIPDFEVSAYLAVTGEAYFGSREEEFDLVIAPTVEEAVGSADAVIIVSRRPGALANEAFVRITLERAPEGSACFVHGVLANSLAGARRFAARAEARGIALLAGTPTSVTWRLPPVNVTPGSPIVEALIVVQVNPLAGQATPPSPPATLGGAALHALEGLLPVIEQRSGGESGVRSVRFLEGEALWHAGKKGLWSWELLAAALSRSDTPQGDAVLDGRTQDLLALGLVPRLARDPRGWLLEHCDGLRSGILVLDGVVADFNFAVRTQDGSTVSAQLFRPPPPAEQHFSQLAAVIEDFFVTRQSPWHIERNILIAGLLELFAKPAMRSALRMETNDLSFHYRSTQHTNPAAR
jgi:hypothetical protein